MSVTIQEIADQLDISVATVSRSLRQDPLIHPSTRARVSEMALKMGYQGRARRGPKLSKGLPTVGVLLSGDSLSESRRYSACPRMLEGITAEADSQKALLQLHSVSNTDRGQMTTRKDAIPPMVLERACDVIILEGQHSPQDVAFLVQHVPIVSMNWRYDGIGIDTAVSDNVNGIRRLVTHLVQLGHRSLTWIPGQHPASFFMERHAGFIQGCLMHGLEWKHQNFLPESIFDYDHILQSPELILNAIEGGTTAFVCANDSGAQEVVRILEESGYEVPRHASVTGFDDAHRITSHGLQFTSFNPQFAEIGRAALQLALRRLNNPSSVPISITMDGTLVEGGTSGPAPEV